MDEIKVQIFGIEDEDIDSGCGVVGGCRGCSSGNHKCGNCGLQNDSDKPAKTMGDSYKELVKYIENSNVGHKVCLEFIDINKLGDIHPYNDIIELVDSGFDIPITVIDGIVRYYGGISGKLIYMDIKELLS